jgi:N-acetyl-alpha-D-glucosaminyl L-malate synthase BshA
MRIGIVCYPTFGGSGVLATELGIGLASKGHEVHFITYKRPARLYAFYENITFHEVNTLDYPLFEYTPYESELASKLVDVVKYENLDVLHVHYAIPHAAVAFMAKQILAGMGIDLPVVTTLHGTDITLVGDNKAFSPVVEFSINKSDAVTAVSAALKRDTHSKFNIENEIQVIYNFIDLERFKKSDKDHFRKAIAPDGETIIVHTSNFRKVKRVGDVIRVFEKIYPRVKAKLLLIGDGPERPKLEQLCRQIGLCSEIRFLGKQDAVEEILAIGDLFILPSANESFGLAALEAMACELPVISSNIGGLPELNIEGVTGHLFDVGDVEGMAEKAIEILSDEEVLKTYKKNAYLRAQEFERSAVVTEYEDLYKATIAKVKSKETIPLT